MGTLSGKVALVTGGSRGIGRAIAIRLAKEGATVIINCSKDILGADITIEAINKFGGYCDKIVKDISIYSNCEELISEVIKSYGKIDILINNAGRSKIGLFIDSSYEDINEIINTNLMSAIYLSKFAVNNMMSRKSGIIINISSIWGEVGAACEVLYSITKGGLNLFTKSLAKEVASCGIRVYGIAPGVINTDMNNCFSNEEIQELIQEIPAGRLGDVEEIAEIALFLCDNKCNYLNGQIIRVDGGFI